MPATAAIDNETLDHLLSVVDDSRNLIGIRGMSKPRGGRKIGGAALEIGAVSWHRNHPASFRASSRRSGAGMTIERSAPIDRHGSMAARHRAEGVAGAADRSKRGRGAHGGQFHRCPKKATLAVHAESDPETTMPAPNS